MSIGLAMIVKDEADWIEPTLDSVRGLISHWTICDTGSTDDTGEIVRHALRDVPGELFVCEWADYGQNRTQALELARDTADWLLMPDADMDVEWHPDLPDWLARDPDPEVGAWNVSVHDEASGSWWSLPRLVRGKMDWSFVGPCHEYLDPAGRKHRPLLGLTFHHMRAGGHDPQRFEQYLDLLREGFEAGDPRATFYTAESLRFLGRTQEAIAAYRKRAAMRDFEEEAWYAEYQAARLEGEQAALFAAWRRRPWRHEPLTAVARLVAAQPHGDTLFMEPAP